MAASRRPKPTTQEAEINALTSKGGSAPESSQKKEKEKGVTPVIIRIPDDILERVDDAVSARPFKTPRHMWLLEAILEKLKKEDF